MSWSVPSSDVLDRAHRRQHRVVGVVVPVQAVAADLLQVVDPLEPAADRVDALAVVRVVHRVGERDAGDVALARPWPGRRGRAARARAWPSSTSSSSSMSQRSSPWKQKYSMPTQAFVVVRDHPRAPGAEVLDPADADARVVDVDPRVREQVLAVDDQRDGEEVAVAQAAARRPGPRRRAAAPAMPTVRAQRQRGDHVAAARSARRRPRSRRPCRRGPRASRPGVSIRTSPPLAMISSAIVSHIWPGPKRG